MQVCYAHHQEDLAFPNWASNTTSRPGPSHFQAWLLQCSSGWSCATKPLQMNSTAHLVFNEPTSLLCSSLCSDSHSLLISSLRCWHLPTDWPQDQLPPLSTHYYKSTSLSQASNQSMSNGLWYHNRVPQNHSIKHSNARYHAGWMISPPSSWMQNPCQHSKDNWKLISSVSTKKQLFFFKSLLIWFMLLQAISELCILSTSCVVFASLRWLTWFSPQL